MKKAIQYIFIFIFISGRMPAQEFHLLDVAVYENGQQLANPWTGGMNAPQWSSFDMNHDGKKDLYAFDRNGHVHLCFINQGNGQGAMDYKYARHWVQYFPAGQNYVLMRDYNHDGATDMFVSAFDEGLSGFKVFKAAFNSDNQLVFERILFPEYTYDIIPFVVDGKVAGPVEIYNNPDYPAIDDLDGDGDLDILTMNALGSKVLFYKNIALESGFNDEVLLYELKSDCWGWFGLTPFSQKLTLSDNAGKCAFFQNPDDEDKRLHGGTTLCTFDADSDGDKEVLYGDLIYPNIIFAKNGGTSDDAWMNEQDTLFPSYDIAVHIPDFPASYYLDINNDGADDLLFSPNLPSGSPDVNTAVFYKNTGIGGEQEFQFQQNNFLAEGMLDFGTGANPVFADVNADGLLDIVVGNRSEWDTLLDKSYLALLLNTGTASEPAYELTDRDWLGLSQYNPDIRALSPAFGDLDGDGDEDLLIGSRTGPLHFFENTAPPGQPMQFAPPVFNWQGIVVGANTTPFIFDVNNDGLLDLLIGERAGNINYFPNIGDPAHPQFHPQEEEAPNNEFFGEITTIAPGGAIGYSQPFAMRSAAGSFIIVGTDAGWLKRYKINPDLLDGGAFELLDEKLGNLREGFISRVCFANINGNNFLEAVVGNDRGGISLFQSPLTIEGLVGNKENYDGRQIGIYPNPVNDFIFIEIKGSAAHFPVAWEVSSPAGRLVLSGTVFSGNKIDVSTLGSGLYFIKIKTKEGIMTEKIVVRHE